MKKVTAFDIAKFMEEYYRQHCKMMRDGQMFCNYFKITDPELFYENEKHKAWARIQERYMEGFPEE